MSTSFIPPNPGHLLRLAHELTGHIGRSEAWVSERITTNATLFVRLRKSRPVQIETYTAGMFWFSANWPEDLAWPDDIPRPAPKSERAA